MSLTANIKINLGDEPQKYVTLTKGKAAYKRSSIKISKKNNLVNVDIEAKDGTALLSSINSVIKQFRVITNTSRMIDRMSKKSQNR